MHSDYTEDQIANLKIAGQLLGVDLVAIIADTESKLKKSLSQARFSAPEKVAANINGVVEAFAHDGLTAEAYAAIAIAHPSLLSLTPEATVPNIQMVKEAHAEGILQYPDDQEDLAGYINKYPACLTVSSDFLAKSIELCRQQSAAYKRPIKKLVLEKKLFHNTLEHLRQKEERAAAVDDQAAPLEGPKTKAKAKSQPAKKPKDNVWYVIENGRRSTLSLNGITMPIDVHVAKLCGHIDKHVTMSPKSRKIFGFEPGMSDMAIGILVKITQENAASLMAIVEATTGKSLPKGTALIEGSYPHPTERVRFSNLKKVDYIKLERS